MSETGLLFNQQVAANIRYQIIPSGTHKALKAAPLFNMVAVAPSKIIVHRPWFGLDRNVEIEKRIRTLIGVGQPEEVAALLNEAKKTDLRTLLAGEKHDIDPQELKEILNSASGAIHIKLPEDMSHEGVAETLNARIPFRKLSRVLERLSRMLKDDGRGALLQIDVNYTSGTDFTNARPF